MKWLDKLNIDTTEQFSSGLEGIGDWLEVGIKFVIKQVTCEGAGGATTGATNFHKTKYPRVYRNHDLY